MYVMYTVEPPCATCGGQNIDPLVHGVFPWTTHMDYPKMDCAAEV